MKLCFYISRITLYTFIFLGAFNLSYSKNLEFNYDAKNISNYFSGLISFDDFDYQASQIYFKNLNNFEGSDKGYSSKFIQSLINLGKYNDAYRYSQKIEREGTSNFESNIFLGLHAFKEKDYIKAKSYFDKLEPNFENKLSFDILKNSTTAWLHIVQSKTKQDIGVFDSFNLKSKNLDMIQKTFANCHLNTPDVEKEFRKLVENKNSNFSRYNFFFANYLFNNDKKDRAIRVTDAASKKYPRNLLINQFKKVLNNQEENKNQFNCKNSADIMGEIFYIIASMMSSQGNYKLSNFYISLSKFLNPKMLSYDSLLAENFTIIKKNDEAEKVYKKLSRIGSIYKWYGSMQIALIMDEKNNEDSLNFLSKAYKDINPGIYETFDLANFLRNKESYEKSIELYSEILSKIGKDHELYPKVLERRGTSYERSDNWNLAEKDLLMSLEILPNEPYVMNYLAYSWVEKNKNIELALAMLKKANDLKKHNGYITDSLGWALYKLKNFLEAEKYLQMAIVLMPRDPVINDHFGDCLWMNNQKIQARYYWKNVLKSDSADEKLKRKIKEKLLFGLQNT